MLESHICVVTGVRSLKVVGLDPTTGKLAEGYQARAGHRFRCQRAHHPAAAVWLQCERWEGSSACPLSTHGSHASYPSAADLAGTVRSPDSLQRVTHLGKIAEAMQAALSFHPVDLLRPGSLDDIVRGACCSTAPDTNITASAGSSPRPLQLIYESWRYVSRPCP